MKKFYNLFILIRSIICCLKILPFKQAIKCPIFVNFRFSIDVSKDSTIQFSSPLRFGMVHLGWEGTQGINSSNGGLYMHSKSKLILGDKICVCKGTSIRIDQFGQIEIGSDTRINKNCFIRSTKIIEIGEKTSIGWNVTINTTDGHNLWVDGKAALKDAPIKIGSHSWIGSNVTICKNVSIAPSTVVAQNSLVTKSVRLERCLVGGIPSKLLRENVEWQR